MGRLAGKVAIVTGAGQGIGQGIAFALAKEGAAIAVVGRTEAKLADTCAAIERAGGRASPVPCDICKADQVTRAVERTVAVFGGVDILVNNAQDMRFGPLLTSTDEDYAVSHESGPLATLRFMRACHPHMKARGGGAIVNVATPMVTQWDSANFGLYIAVKEAIRALTRSAANEWGGDGIRVNTIAPLAMTARMRESLQGAPDKLAEMERSIPMRRVGEPERDIGRAVVFMVSPDASYLTGATVPLDGGRSNLG